MFQVCMARQSVFKLKITIRWTNRYDTQSSKSLKPKLNRAMINCFVSFLQIYNFEGKQNGIRTLTLLFFTTAETSARRPLENRSSSAIEKMINRAECPLRSSISPILIAGARSRQIHAYFRAGCEQWRPVGSLDCPGNGNRSDSSFGKRCARS